MTAEEKFWSELYLGVLDVLLKIFLEYMAVSQQYFLGLKINLQKPVIILDCIIRFVQIFFLSFDNVFSDVHLNL